MVCSNNEEFQEINDAYALLLEHLGAKDQRNVETADPAAQIANSVGEKQTSVSGNSRQEVRAFRCKHCDKAFIKKHHMERHVRGHTGEKPLVCNVCQKSFRHNYDLAVHCRAHTGERPHMCPAEGWTKAFREKKYLKAHMRMHTGEKPHRCSQCDKSFAQKHLLRCHEDFHSGNHRYKCSDCLAAFVRPDLLKEHRKVHSNGGPTFDCAKCGRCFSQRGCLAAHTKKCQVARL